MPNRVHDFDFGDTPDPEPRRAVEPAQGAVTDRQVVAVIILVLILCVGMLTWPLWWPR